MQIKLKELIVGASHLSNTWAVLIDEAGIIHPDKKIKGLCGGVGLYLAFYRLGVDGIFSDFANTAIAARSKYLKADSGRQRTLPSFPVVVCNRLSADCDSVRLHSVEDKGAESISRWYPVAWHLLSFEGAERQSNLKTVVDQQ